MPSGPKWDGKNRHARDAAERDAERTSDKKARDAQAREDAMWADDRSSKQKKAESRKDDEQTKAEEARRRKADVEAEYQREMASLDKGVPSKVAKRDAQKEVSKSIVMGSLRDTSRDITRPAPLPQSNPNHGVSAEATGDLPQAAGAGAGADRAKAATLPEDRHIGKRAKVAYKKFCEQQMPALKEDKKLRRSQINDILWAMWQKCPDNPFVQRAETRADEALRRKWYEADDDDDEGDAAAP
jgi:hypothetical protein